MPYQDASEAECSSSGSPGAFTGTRNPFDCKPPHFAMRVVIAVAGMEGALSSVLGRLAPGVMIALPTSVGCGAACAALRILG